MAVMNKFLNNSTYTFCFLVAFFFFVSSFFYFIYMNLLFLLYFFIFSFHSVRPEFFVEFFECSELWKIEIRQKINEEQKKCVIA